MEVFLNYNQQVRTRSATTIMFYYNDISTFSPYLCSFQPIMFMSPYLANFYQAQENLSGNAITTINQKKWTQAHPREKGGPSITLEDTLKDDQVSPLILNISKIESQEWMEQELLRPVENRNILPNNLNLLLSHLRRINKSGKIVARIMKSLGDDRPETVRKFYSYQAYLKDNSSQHRNRHSLAQITLHLDPACPAFTVEEQLLYNRVSRTLIAHFLRGEYLQALLTSSKIQKTSKMHHLRIQRYLLLRLNRKSPSP